MIEKLQNIMIKEFGLYLELKHFGDNFARNNVFLGENKEKSYIIKLEDVNQLNQVKLSINIASNLLKSDIICSSQYLKTKNEEFLLVIDDKVVTVQVKEDLIKLSPKNHEDLIQIGQILGEFHNLLLNMNIENLDKSDFYKDFMWGEVPKAEPFERLEEIKAFFNRYTPDYQLLTKGVVHNDLNLNNIFQMGDKHFFIDFEFLKKSPLISDLGILVLEIWNYKKGAKDYLDKLMCILEGYEMKIKLSEYDKKNIIIFSLRYLFSDENWYNYWSFNGNPDAIHLISEIRKKQNLLLQIIR